MRVGVHQLSCRLCAQQLPKALGDRIGDGGGGSCDLAACGMSPRLGFLTSDLLLWSGPPYLPLGHSLSPPPLRFCRVRAGGPEAEPGCGHRANPIGGAGLGAGDPRLPWLLARDSPDLRGAERGGGGGGGGQRTQKAPRGATSLFPPSLRLLQLKRVFPVGLLSQSAPPGLPEPAWRRAPPRPGCGRALRPGPGVEPLERLESVGPGFQLGLQASGAFSHPPPIQNRWSLGPP